MTRDKLIQDLKQASQKLGLKIGQVQLAIPDNPSFGDYSTNIALQQASLTDQKTYQSARDIANAIAHAMQSFDYLASVQVAGPGFINFFLTDQTLTDVILKSSASSGPVSSKKYLIEYGHTNPLKEIHIGHLRTFILGESLARVLEYQGNQVFRANYQGDIGLHIAKAVWGIIQAGGLPDLTDHQERANFLGQVYAKANAAYESTESVKQEIDQINIKLYQKDPKYQPVYQTARDWSLEYFQPIYQRLDIDYDRCFFESEVYQSGQKIVLDNVGPIFTKDNGAIIFPGQQYGLHNRVFITSTGNPTYEGKEIGLAKLEYDTYAYDQSIHVVASEQAGYFEVVIKAIEMVFPHLKGKKHHLSYGLVDLSSGKMSSRTGNVVTIDKLYDLVSAKVRQVMTESKLSNKEEVIDQVSWGAIKFAYLKYAPVTNMVFDLDQSVSLQGDSGPYLQYSYARSQSLLAKAGHLTRQAPTGQALVPEERALLRQLEYFDFFVDKAISELQTNVLCEYLLNLAKAFNLFYQKCPVINSDQANFRLSLTNRVADSLKTGLHLLGISAPEKM